MATVLAPASVCRGPGRPREFDLDEALDRAIEVFRRRGYHATSIADLGEAMGLTPGSIYKAFKDKRAVFLAAFDRYVSRSNDRLRGRLDPSKPGRQQLRDLLAYYVEASHDSEGRLGCLVVGTAAELAIFDREVEARVAAAMRTKEEMMAAAIRAGQSDGSISADLDSTAAARFLLCLAQGLRVFGKTGPDLAQMAASIDVALRAFD